MDLTEKACATVALPPPDYSECLARATAVSKPPSTFKAPASKPETTSPVSRAAAWRPGCLTHRVVTLGRGWALSAGPSRPPSLSHRLPASSSLTSVLLFYVNL